MTPCIVVFDLEFTAWQGSLQRNWQGPGEFREIVQIGAVKLTTNNLREVASLSLLVKPRINPSLSAYFTHLTRITQESVDVQGWDFSRALRAFALFAQDAQSLLCNGNDHLVILENCQFAESRCPIAAARFHNVAPTIARTCGVRSMSSSQLPNAFPGVPQLPAHDALADARMVAAALAVMRSRSIAIPGIDASQQEP